MSDLNGVVPTVAHSPRCARLPRVAPRSGRREQGGRPMTEHVRPGGVYEAGRSELLHESERTHVTWSAGAGGGKDGAVDELRPVVTGRDGWPVAGELDQYRRDLECQLTSRSWTNSPRRLHFPSRPGRNYCDRFEVTSLNRYSSRVRAALCAGVGRHPLHGASLQAAPTSSEVIRMTIQARQSRVEEYVEHTTVGRGRVVVADDDVLVREGVISLLQRSGFEVVGQAGDAAQLLELVSEHRPDLAIIDIRMPPAYRTEGLAAAHHIREEFSDIGIVLLSAYVEVDDAMELLASCERVGYLLKSRVIDVDEFIDTLERIMKGGS